MKLNEHFKSVESYAAGMQAWVQKYFDSVGNYKMKHSFVEAFAIADWVSGAKGVKDTYKKLLKEYGNNYKDFTELVMAINMLSWGNDQLRKQDIEGREEYIQLYSELYYESRDAFYDKFENDSEACDYFFEMTD